MRVEDEKLVSVIICNYNYGQYLSEAIRSVFDQSYQNLQVIVVDDGSTDDSREILESVDDERLQLIYQENSGQGAAFNAGFEKCSGEYVAFLDSDDFWYQQKLAVSIPAFQSGNISIVQHNMHIVDADSAHQGGVHPGVDSGRKSIHESYFKENHTGFFCPTSGIVCRKTDLDKIFPIDANWKICADVAFTRPLPIFGDIVTLGEELGGYRIHAENNWMNSDDQQKWLENQQAYIDYTNKWLERSGYEEKIVFKKPGLLFPYLMRVRKLFEKTMRRFGS